MTKSNKPQKYMKNTTKKAKQTNTNSNATNFKVTYSKATGEENSLKTKTMKKTKSTTNANDYGVLRKITGTKSPAVRIFAGLTCREMNRMLILSFFEILRPMNARMSSKSDISIALKRFLGYKSQYFHGPSIFRRFSGKRVYEDYSVPVIGNESNDADVPYIRKSTDFVTDALHRPSE